MSASLVGSEMCIRDRRSARPWPLASGVCDRRWTVVGCRLAVRAWSGTVSYTHLTLPTICSV
eukprot:4773393-Alexandrium_andersonii.AAC.1